MLLCCGIAQAAASPRVVVSIAPLHSLVAGVMAGIAEPRLLLRGRESPHSFSLRPSEARLVRDADLFFWIGPPLETPLARILPNLEVSRTVAMLDTPGLHILRARNLIPAGNATTDHGHRHTDEGPDTDPHIWLSPANAGRMVTHIAQALSETDPSRAEGYRRNARQLQERLQLLDHELRQRLTALGGRYLVFHDAYQYLEEAYGLEPLASVTTHAERSPGAAHLHKLRGLMERHQVRCLFSEPQYQPRLVAMLGEGLPVQHAILDPLGIRFPAGPEAYFQMMRGLTASLAGCMQGEPAP